MDTPKTQCLTNGALTVTSDSQSSSFSSIGSLPEDAPHGKNALPSYYKMPATLHPSLPGKDCTVTYERLSAASTPTLKSVIKEPGSPKNGLKASRRVTFRVNPKVTLKTSEKQTDELVSLIDEDQKQFADKPPQGHLPCNTQGHLSCNTKLLTSGDLPFGFRRNSAPSQLSAVVCSQGMSGRYKGLQENASHGKGATSARLHFSSSSHHHFSSLHQLSSSSAPTPSPSSSTSSTPSSARLAANGGRGVVGRAKHQKRSGPVDPLVAPHHWSSVWCHEDPPVGVRDSTSLPIITTDTLAQNFAMRYNHDCVHTRIGGALVIVNPMRPLPLYGPDKRIIHRISDLPPHLFAVVEEARRGVCQMNEDRLIVMAGESGGGKSENVKRIFEYLEGVGGVIGAGVRVVEAFGNACTVNNMDASRCTKHVEMALDHRGVPTSTKITAYLMDKFRVTSYEAGDRNYHIFYQLLSGSDAATLKSLRLHRNCDYYNILRQKKYNGSFDDREQYVITKAALDKLCISPKEQKDLFSVLASVLKLSTLTFATVNNIDGTEGCAVQNEYELREVSELLQCSVDSLSECLTCSTTEVGEQSRELGVGEANHLRDILCQELYNRLFAWVVTRVNTSLTSAQSIIRHKTLGVLDPSGFCSSSTSFSQFIINVSSERINQTLRQRLLQDPQEEFLREGLEWRNLEAEVEVDSLRLCQEPHTGLLALLEKCSGKGLTSDSHSHFLKLMTESLSNNASLQITGEQRGTSQLFRVSHYAGSVSYSATDFVSHNTSHLPQSLRRCLFLCHNTIVKKLFPEGNPERPMHKRPSSVVSQCQIAIGTMLRTVRDRALHTVYCLTTHRHSKPVDASVLIQQVKYLGLVEVCKLSIEGYYWSCTHEEFLRRYRMVSSHTWCPPWVGSPLEGSSLLLADLSVAPSDYTFGRTKVYIKTLRALEDLESIRNSSLSQLVALIQGAWRSYLQYRAFCRLRTAQVVISQAWRRYKSLCTSNLPNSTENKTKLDLTLVRNVLKYRKQNWAASVIQTAYVNFMRRQLLTELLTFPPSSSPTADDWPTAPLCISHLSCSLQAIHHMHRCQRYRLRFDQSARNRMREKVTASMLFRNRKASYARSVAHPFKGDYIKLRQNSQWRKVSAENNDQFVVFADIVNKITRSAGKFVPILLVLSTNALMVLDQRTLQLKYRIAATDIARISLSPYVDDIAVVHVHTPTPHTDISPASTTSISGGGGCLFTSDDAAGKRKGDLVVQTCHIIELVTKLFLVVQNATGTPPNVTISPEFETNFGESAVVFLFRASGLGEVGSGHIRINRRSNRMEVLL